MLQPRRYTALMDSRLAYARRLGLDPKMAEALFAAIHAESVRRQLKMRD